eukprot:3674027-Prymnesium_polylepis.2
MLPQLEDRRRSLAQAFRPVRADVGRPAVAATADAANSSLAAPAARGALAPARVHVHLPGLAQGLLRRLLRRHGHECAHNNGARPTSITKGTSVEWTDDGTHDYKLLLDLWLSRAVYCTLTCLTSSTTAGASTHRR